MMWIPLRLVVFAPLAGANASRPAGLVRAQAGAIVETMRAFRPQLRLSVPRIPTTDVIAQTPATTVSAPATTSSGLTDVALEFTSLEDFTPLSLVERVPALAALNAARNADVARCASIDGALSRALDAILHHPAFRELESAWRGLAFLVERGAAGSDSNAALVIDVAATGTQDDHALFRQQVFDPDYEDRSEIPAAAILADVEFDHQPASVASLTHYGQLAKTLQTPFIACAGASLFGLKNMAHLPALSDLATRTSGGPYAAWMALQRDEIARWISLALNRFLLRAPYGSEDPDPNASQTAVAGPFRYVEAVDPAHPEWHAWGRPVWTLGASLAASFAEHGHCAACDGLSGKGAHHALPTREMLASPGKKTRLATEILIDDQKAWDLVRAGVTPLLGMADGDVAYFPFVGNIYRPRLGSVTLDQTLSYYLYLGQLSHLVLRLLPQAPAGSSVDRAAWLESQIFMNMSPFVGDAPGEHVRVAALDAGGAATASISVSPTFKLQDKSFTLEIGVPI
jgi:type VI secretion system protein ImpC